MRTWLFVNLLALVIGHSGFARADAPARSNVASFGAGALVVKQPAAYSDSWSGFWLLDEDPATGYATPNGDTTAKEFVIELANRDKLDEVAFDVAGVDGDGTSRAAKDVVVELADKVDGPWSPLVTVVLAAGKDDQHFKAAKPVAGRYLRVRVTSNHGASDYVEIMGFAAFGTVDKKLPVSDFSGQYASNYGTFHVKATGATATGCYEWKDGLIQNGGFDGRVLRFTWREGKESGPAVLVFPADGKTFLGLWWRDGTPGLGGRWDGTFKTKSVGTCPHYKFDAAVGKGGEVAESLRKDGRVRLYGINFDFDSDHLRDESKPTLDQLVASAKAEPTWKLAIEGHTDGVGTADHNQQLSEKRAEAVKAYLVKAKVAADRLSTKGFGATKPIASNTTALGRSQNRRVEVARN